MNITSKDFKKISIRSRVAYSICCLENAMEHYKIFGDGWNILLETLWEFTSLSGALDETRGELYLEKWMNVANYLPDMSYFSGVETYLDWKAEFERCLWQAPCEQEYNKLLNDYKNKNLIIVSLVNTIFDLGTIELYAGIDSKSQDTLDWLQKVIDIMKQENIPLPDMTPFKKYDFHVDGWDHTLHGWGITFDGKQYSKILK